MVAGFGLTMRAGQVACIPPAVLQASSPAQQAAHRGEQPAVDDLGQQACSKQGNTLKDIKMFGSGGTNTH